MGNVAREDAPRPRPNWALWRQMAQVKYSDAVSLSLDLDPKKFQRGWSIHDYPDLNERLGVAMNHLQAGTLRVNALMLTLPAFAEWATRLGWDLPSDFPRPEAATTSAPGGQGRWPWGTYETKLLRLLAEAAQEHWTSYDPSLPATAPPSVDVQAWLIKRGASIRVAEVMAQILRPNDLKAGPHNNPGDGRPSKGRSKK